MVLCLCLGRLSLDNIWAEVLQSRSLTYWNWCWVLWVCRLPWTTHWRVWYVAPYKGEFLTSEWSKDEWLFSCEETSEILMTASDRRTLEWHITANLIAECNAEGRPILLSDSIIKYCWLVPKIRLSHLHQKNKISLSSLNWWGRCVHSDMGFTTKEPE